MTIEKRQGAREQGKEPEKELNPEQLEPGMVVEATEGDLGEADLSKPRLEEVVRDEQGQPQKLVVKKGVIFSKKIEIPLDRLRTVEPLDEAKAGEDPSAKAKVVVAASQQETEALSPVGAEPLAKDKEDGGDVLHQVEHSLPTAEGLRHKEANRRVEKAEAGTGTKTGATSASDNTEGANLTTGPQKKNWWKVLGPGFLGGMAGNDSSAVTSYSVDGATNGYGHLWLLLLATPLYQAVQYTCAKVGRITQKGFAELLREHYGRPVAGLASLILIVANLSLIAADLLAIGAGFELLTGISWGWFVIPVALLLWYITVYRNFGTIKKIFIVMSLAFVAYLVTALLSGADWGTVAANTFIPQLDFSFKSISSAVALLGATISPYTMFWQVLGEKEEQRAGSTREKLREAALDIASGTVSGNLVAYAIIVCTSATLFSRHQNINTAADAARALEPLLGPLAKYLFAIGLIGAGLIAIPVLLASTAYAVADTFKLPAGLSKKPWQSEGFYLILTVALIAGVVIALLGFDPVQLMFWANVLNGVLSPVLVIFLWLVSTNPKVMSRRRVNWLTKAGLILTALVMLVAAGLLFYSLFTGQAS